MKKLFLVFLSSFSSWVCWGQTIKDTDKHKQVPSPFISFNIGLGIPTNNFYMEELAGQPGGGSYATTGYNINISGGIPIAHSHWGIAGLISYNAEPFNITQRFLDLCVQGNNNQLVSSSYSDYKETLLMAGVFFSTKGKVRIDFKLLVGDNLYTTAGYSLLGTSTTTMARFNSSIDIISSLRPINSSAMAFDLGVSLWLLQKKHLFVLFSPDFMYSQASINTTYNDSYSLFSQHLRVNYNLLSLTTGIGYKF